MPVIEHGGPGCLCDAEGEHPECPHHGYEAVIRRLTDAIHKAIDYLDHDEPDAAMVVLSNAR